MRYKYIETMTTTINCTFNETKAAHFRAISYINAVILYLIIFFFFSHKQKPIVIKSTTKKMHTNVSPCAESVKTATATNEHSYTIFFSSIWQIAFCCWVIMVITAVYTHLNHTGPIFDVKLNFWHENHTAHRRFKVAREFFCFTLIWIWLTVMPNGLLRFSSLCVRFFSSLFWFQNEKWENWKEMF